MAVADRAGMAGADMVAVGMGMTWFGYSLVMYGYCLVRGYDVSFRDCFRTQWPGATTQPPTAGHKLGTITGHVNTSNPGQTLGP